MDPTNFQGTILELRCESRHGSHKALKAASPATVWHRGFPHHTLGISPHPVPEDVMTWKLEEGFKNGWFFFSSEEVSNGSRGSNNFQYCFRKKRKQERIRQPWIWKKFPKFPCTCNAQNQQQTAMFSNVAPGNGGTSSSSCQNWGAIMNSWPWAV